MAAIWQAPALAFCPAPLAPKTAEVRRVIDGDTLRLADGRSVRLIGINTPEIGRKGKPGEALGETARRRLAVLVRESGGRVDLVAGRESRDKYGRTLAHVYARSGDNLAARLLGEGLGYRVAVAPNNRLVVCQRRAEQAARKARIGLWRTQSPVMASDLRRPGFAVVGGKVSAISRHRGAIRLEIDRSLVVSVPRGVPLSFTSGLKGQRVEVRGWVLERSRNGGSSAQAKRWLLPLSDASMLERIGS
ncbi:thermonuclease family protein [Pseudomonas sp. 148P]|uniref:Thermonuclease family protein n=1 Tax=Pseudomonas ulcerans TaxID=3115852 RepID=A0ABU7HME5_9PSED|nr:MULTISPECIES: thermonuclease family protein [unclassified Pseudomonas]MEE1921735.1 thermonuclease family protein [Pseudomonas sp. 147P]MEE1932706.1 thermonuclease family protein [Pseudomonas sp. 148P]